MKVTKGQIPQGSLISTYLPVDYSDVYTCDITNTKNITPDDIQVAFWTKMPGWVNNLFKLRNILVKPFGLDSNEKSNLQEFAECIRTGGKYNFVSIPQKSPNETVLCLEDKHLMAYLSVYIQRKEENENTIYTTTLVNFHKKFGYVYFYAIYPFHHLVVRKMVVRTLKNLLSADT